MTKLKNIPMKYLLTAFLCCILFPSCKVIKEGRTPKEVPPFVQLKNGKIINAKEIGTEVEFGNRNQLFVDGVAYDKDSISYLSNGTSTFANMGKRKFLPKYAEGKINIYRYHVYVSPHSHYAIYDQPTGFGGEFYGKGDFVQDSGSKEFHVYGYKSLKQMIPPNTPAGKMLHSYKTGKIESILVLLGGVGCFFAGAAIAGNATLKDKGDSQINTGMAMTFGGMGIIGGGFISIGLNKFKIKKALGIYNGVYFP